jgi:Uma2 family endonuclease
VQVQNRYRQSARVSSVQIPSLERTSLDKDRGVKTALYAAAGVPEFWLVNLLDRVVEVHRQPPAGRYGAIERTDVDSVIAPAALPSLQVAVRELFE